VLAEPLKDIWTIDAGRVNADEHFIGSRFRHRSLDRAKHFGAAEVADLDCVHDGISIRSLRSTLNSKRRRSSRR
jgi:hypothetical protein